MPCEAARFLDLGGEAHGSSAGGGSDRSKTLNDASSCSASASLRLGAWPATFLPALPDEVPLWLPVPTALLHLARLISCSDMPSSSRRGSCAPSGGEPSALKSSDLPPTLLWRGGSPSKMSRSTTSKSGGAPRFGSDGTAFPLLSINRLPISPSSSPQPSDMIDARRGLGCQFWPSKLSELSLFNPSPCTVESRAALGSGFRPLSNWRASSTTTHKPHPNPQKLLCCSAAQRRSGQDVRRRRIGN